MRDPDIVVIGGGHNGLISAAYLAKVGFKVCVVEQYHKVGGGVITEELTLPGFKHDTHSVVHVAIRANPLIKNDELGLISKYGLEYIVPNIPLVALFEDGTSIFIYRDVERTIESMSRISLEDAKSYRKFVEWGTELSKIMQKMANRFEPLPETGTTSEPLTLGRIAEYGKWGRLLIKWPPLTMLNLLTRTFLDVLDYWFVSPKLKALLAKMGSEFLIPPYETGSAIPITIALLGNHMIGSGIPKGGSGMLCEALERCLKDHGGEVITNSEVKSIMIKNGIASGVKLKDGIEIPTKHAVVSSINVKQLFGKLIDERELPNSFLFGIQRLRHGPYTSISSHYALREAPSYKNGEDVGTALRVELVSTVEDLLREFEEIRRGIIPTESFPLVVAHTVHDPSRAPAGSHTLWLYSFVPYELTGRDYKGWEQEKERAADDLLKKLRRFTTNMGTENILARHVESPVDMERRNSSFIQGDHEHLAHIMSQMLFNRPLPGWSRYRTPIKKLYMCGASTHPGGGVSGGARAAVQIIMNDLGLKGKVSEILQKHKG